MDIIRTKRSQPRKQPKKSTMNGQVSRFEQAMLDLQFQEVAVQELEQKEESVEKTETNSQIQDKIINTMTDLKIYTDHEMINFFNINSVVDFEEFILNNASL